MKNRRIQGKGSTDRRRSIWRKPDCKWIRSEGIAGWHQTSQRRGIIRSDTDREKCHSGCEIYKIMGDCIMPREGIFTRVLHGGVLTEGDEIVIEKAAGEADGGAYWCECGTFDNL